MGGVGLGGSQAPLATAGEVGSDPLPVRTGGLGGALDAATGLFAVVQFVDAVERQRALQDLGVAVGVSVQLGRVRACRAGDGRLLCGRHRRHGSTVGGDLMNTGRSGARTHFHDTHKRISSVKILTPPGLQVE